MQFKVLHALTVSTLALGTLAAPNERRQVTFDGLVIPATIVSELVNDVETLFNALPTTLVNEIEAAIPTNFLDDIPEIIEGDEPAWVSTLETLVPSSVVNVLLDDVEAIETQFAPFFSSASSLLAGITSAPVAPITTVSPAYPITPSSNGTAVTTGSSNGTVATSVSPPAATNFAMKMGGGVALTAGAAAGVLGLAFYL